MKDTEKEEVKLTTQKDKSAEELLKKSERLIEILTKREEERHGCGYYILRTIGIFFIMGMAGMVILQLFELFS